MVPRPARPLLLLATAVAAVFAALGPWAARGAGATVFYAREEMPKLAFPDADEVAAKDYFLTAKQHATVEERARTKIESDFVTVYTGVRDSRATGYAFVDTRVVRTLPETLLIVLGVDGTVTATYLLAFYEPLEYQPSERWLAQLEGQKLNDDLRVGGRVAAITGSTLSSRAVVDGVRRALALYEVLLAPCASSSPESGQGTGCSR